MAKKKIQVDVVDTTSFRGWLVVWLGATAAAGFIIGGNLYPDRGTGGSGDGSSFGVPGAVGVALGLLVSNVPVVLIVELLVRIYREQVQIKCYARAAAEAQLRAANS